MQGNLPDWQGASAAYSRAYRILAAMARRGHVQTSANHRGKQCFPSQEMRDYIEALDKGNEEAIKFFNLKHLELDPQLRP